MSAVWPLAKIGLTFEGTCMLLVALVIWSMELDDSGIYCRVFDVYSDHRPETCDRKPFLICGKVRMKDVGHFDEASKRSQVPEWT